MTSQVHETVMAYFEAVDPNPESAERFIALFDEQAHFEDPVGSRTLVGHEGIAKFHKGLTRAWSQLRMSPERIYVRGSQAAVSWTAEGHSATGKDIQFDGINLIEVDSNGRISSLRGYWDLEAMIAQM
jgi:steroid delta-isomerase